MRKSRDLQLNNLALSNAAEASIFELIEVKDFDLAIGSIQSGCSSPNEKDYRGSTAFHRAIEAQSIQLITTMIDFNIDVSATNKNGQSGLYLLIENRHYNLAEQVVDQCDATDFNSHSYSIALQRAIEKNQANLVKKLLAKGGDANFENRYGRTAWELMSQSSSPQFIDLAKVNSAQTAANEWLAEFNTLQEVTDINPGWGLFGLWVSPENKRISQLKQHIIEVFKGIYDKDSVRALFCEDGVLAPIIDYQRDGSSSVSSETATRKAINRLLNHEPATHFCGVSW